MRFLVCPTNCSSGVDDSPAGTPKAKPRGNNEEDTADRQCPSSSLGFKNVFRTLVRASGSSRRSKSKFYRISEETTPPMKRKSAVRDLSKSSEESNLINYNESPKRFAKDSRTLCRTASGMVPPEKPKRSLVGKNESARKSQSLSPKKTAIRSPLTARVSTFKSRKMRNTKKTPTVYKETSFLSTILEESPRK